MPDADNRDALPDNFTEADEEALAASVSEVDYPDDSTPRVVFMLNPNGSYKGTSVVATPMQEDLDAQRQSLREEIVGNKLQLALEAEIEAIDEAYRKGMALAMEAPIDDQPIHINKLIENRQASLQQLQNSADVSMAEYDAQVEKRVCRRMFFVGILGTDVPPPFLKMLKGELQEEPIFNFVTGKWETQATANTRDLISRSVEISDAALTPKEREILDMMDAAHEETVNKH